ncbi:MAG TPA: amidohydrolase [Acidimicrobiia bacterium]|nr:amidohydrolase [Acidimicrobiia bacterium]
MPADLVFVNGPIFTAGPARSFVRALAVSGDRISAMGDEREVSRSMGDATRVVDLAGRLMTPGFQDAHCHPGSSGLDLLRCSFAGCRDGDDAVAYIAGYAARHPDREWILGSGWQQTWFPRGCPPKETLDAVVPDRPVLVYNADGHGAWANSLALTMAGVDASTPDPPDGRIERGADGEPQGTLHEGAARLVERLGPVDTEADVRAGILAGQEYLLSKGITTWQDAHVDAATHAAYRSLVEAGQLVGTAVAALWWERDRGLDQIGELEQMRSETLGRYLPTAVKLMLDGVVENNTASMIEPYHDRDGGLTDDTGLDFIEPGLLREIVTELDRNGFSCHFHAIGDGAVRSALDAVEAARIANGWSRARHNISHIQVVHPDDLPRFRRLGVIANAQALWAQDGPDQADLTLPYLGPERAGWQYPFASLLREGATLAMGSDWGVSTADVMDQIDSAVTRLNHDQPWLAPLNGSERITFLDGLAGFTAGSAYVNHRDDVSGTLAVGMLADLAVLDRDPVASGHIRDASVAMTVVGGLVVFEEV